MHSSFRQSTLSDRSRIASIFHSVSSMRNGLHDLCHGNLSSPGEQIRFSALPSAMQSSFRQFSHLSTLSARRIASIFHVSSLCKDLASTVTAAAARNAKHQQQRLFSSSQRLLAPLLTKTQVDSLIQKEYRSNDSGDIASIDVSDPLLTIFLVSRTLLSAADALAAA
jgi:hypothetical protein